MIIILFIQVLSSTASLIRSTVKNSHSRVWLTSLDSEYFLFLNSFIKEICFELYQLAKLLTLFFEVHESHV